MPVKLWGLVPGHSSHEGFINTDEIIETIGAAEMDANSKRYLTARWLHHIRWLDKWAWQARAWYFRLRFVIVIGGVSVTFLSSVSFSAGTEHYARWAAAIISVVVAAVAGLEALYNWGGIWLEKRRAAELLKVEGWLFLQGAGRYRGKNTGEAFKGFVNEVEAQIAAEVGQYVATSEAAQRNGEPGSSNETA